MERVRIGPPSFGGARNHRPESFAARAAASRSEMGVIVETCRSISAIGKFRKNIVKDNTNRSLDRGRVIMRSEIPGGSGQQSAHFGICE